MRLVDSATIGISRKGDSLMGLSEEESWVAYDGVDASCLFRAEVKVVKSGKVAVELGDGRCADDAACHSPVSEHPCQSHLSYSLSSLCSYGGELFHGFHPFLCHLALLEKPRGTCSSASFGYAVGVFAREQPLCEGREADDAAAVVGCYLEVGIFSFGVKHRAAVLRQKTWHLGLSQNVVASLLELWRIFRDAHVESLALADKINERLHSLFDGGHTVVPMAVEDVEVFQSCALEALVAACYEVFAAAVAAVDTRPHVVSRL